MTRQIAIGFGAPSVPELEDRIHVLETQVALLIEAVRVLSAGLEGSPFDEPGGQATATSARRAHELLITAVTPRRTG